MSHGTYKRGGLVLVLLALLLPSCAGREKKPRPPARETIASADIAAMQLVLLATFNEQGWRPARQTPTLVSVGQPMQPGDATRYALRWDAGLGDPRYEYEFQFKPLPRGRTEVSARFLGVAPASYDRLQIIVLTDKEAEKQLEKVLRALKKSTEKRR